MVIDGELPSLNEVLGLAKRHLSRYAALKKGYTNLIASLARAQMKTVEEYPVTVMRLF